MSYNQGRVGRAMVISRAKLVGGDKVISVNVGQDTCRDDFFQQFPAALQEAYGAICFWQAVVWFVWLWKNDDLGIFPRMVAQGNCGIEKRGKSGWGGLESPLE